LVEAEAAEEFPDISAVDGLPRRRSSRPPGAVRRLALADIAQRITYPDDSQCSICLEPLRSDLCGMLLACKHQFHWRCLESLVKGPTQIQCSVCRCPMDPILASNSQTERNGVMNSSPDPVVTAQCKQQTSIASTPPSATQPKERAACEQLGLEDLPAQTIPPNDQVSKTEDTEPKNVHSSDMPQQQQGLGDFPAQTIPPNDQVSKTEDTEPKNVHSSDMPQQQQGLGDFPAQTIPPNDQVSKTEGTELKHFHSNDMSQHRVINGQANASAGASQSRESLLTSLFTALDTNFDGHVAGHEMLIFAKQTGFDGSMEAWDEEYRLLCKTWEINPLFGFRLDRFKVLVNDHSDRGCYCDDSELRSVLGNLRESALPEEQGLPGATQPQQPGGADKGTSSTFTFQQEETPSTIRINTSAVAQINAATSVASQAHGQPPSQDVAPQNEISCSTTPGNAVVSNTCAKVASNDVKCRNPAQSVEQTSALLHEPSGSMPAETTSEAHPPGRFRSKLQGKKLLLSVFDALDQDGDELLSSRELRRFAELSGFEGDDADWSLEYRLMCREWQVLPDAGIPRDVFTALVTDKSEIGCYCDEARLRVILKSLLDDATKMKRGDTTVHAKSLRDDEIKKAEEETSVDAKPDDASSLAGTTQADTQSHADSTSTYTTIATWVSTPVSASSRIRDGPIGAAPNIKRAGGSDLEREEAVAVVEKLGDYARAAQHIGQQNRPNHGAKQTLDLSCHVTQLSKRTAVAATEDAAATSAAWTPQLRLSPAGAVPRTSSRAPRSPRTSKASAGGVARSLGELRQWHETDEFFLNTCAMCGETRRLPADLGCDFICADAGQQCSLCHEDMAEAQASKPHLGEESDDKAALRRKLLCRVLGEGMTALEAADLLLGHGLDTTHSGELEALRVSLQEKRAQQSAGARLQERQARDSKAVRKPQRYLDGKLVEVQKGTRYLVEPKESLEQKQATSVSIPIYGSRAKPTRETKKKGPQS